MPRSGQGCRLDFGRTVGTVAPVTAAPRARVLVTAGLAALLAASLIVGRADGAGTSWSVYLAPESACRSADDPAAAADVQARAVTCLVNWARAHDSRKRLVRRQALQRAATLKGERVASCGQFSHTPCGSAVTAAVQAAGYRYATFGENLFAGTWGQISARDVVERLAPVAPASRERPGRELQGRRRRSGSCARPPRRRRRGRLDGDVRLASIDRAGVEPPSREGPARARGEPPRRDAQRDSRRLRAPRGAAWRAGAHARERARDSGGGSRSRHSRSSRPSEPRRSWLARMLST